MEVVPWLLGWDEFDADGELRKAFEVALHAGTAAALVIALRSDARRVGLRELRLIVAAAAPPALAGYVFERPVERHLGSPPTIAAGLLAGSLAMAAADRLPGPRRLGDAQGIDALCLGLAQASALVPGVSRTGAAVAAARARGFARPDAHRLARHVGLPVIAGAAALKTVRIARRGVDPRSRARLLAGAASAFASTLAAARLIPWIERDRPLWPYAAYRIGVAAAVCRRLGNRTSGGSSTIRA